MAFGYFTDFKDKSRLKDLYMRVFGYPYAPRRNEARKAIRLLAPKRDERILDLGCGDGVFTNSLARDGYTILGLDHSSRDIEKARSRAKAEGLKAEYSTGDMHNLPFEEGTFDKALAISVFEHVENDQRALEQIYKVLKPGGELVVSVYGSPYYLFTKFFIRLPMTIKKLFFNNIIREAKAPEDYKRAWDIKYNHYRNYSVGSITEKMERAGYKIVKIDYHIRFFGSFLLSFIHSLRIFSWEKKKESEYVFKNEMIFALLFPLFYALFILDELLFWRKGITPIVKARKEIRK